MTIAQDFQINWNDQETLIVDSGSIHLEFAKGSANQLILCARMNPLERFLAMLEKKVEGNDWTNLSAQIATLDRPEAWKFKEKFARLQTIED